MDEPTPENGTAPEPITVQLQPAKGHIVISLGLDDVVSFATIGNPGGQATLYGLLEMAKDAVRQVAEAASKPRIMTPGGRPPGLPWKRR